MKIFTFFYLTATTLVAPAQQAGIQANLNIQAQELKGVQTLQSLVQSASISSDAKTFQAERKSVLNIQAQGISIRANNQNLAQQIDSPAIAGLAIVATAQVKEMSQVRSLNGTSADTYCNLGDAGAGSNGWDEAESEDFEGCERADV
ncbi:hypothetical protein EK21DRAFT_90297 [Setomelanomma holmii]|uniref:Uncharacterized protein n=1 Tax=Setomelanomma holmii TaxID=210430 RepID=A0A9P4H8C3_9PLEO|nr:hypothetical protein EK21DRAFT_90297 [Setomelanomma holmii]